MEIGDVSTGEWLAIGGGGLGAVSAMLPWISFIGFDPGVGIGLDRELIPLLCGVAVVALVLVADWTDAAQLVAGLLGATILGVGGYTVAELAGYVGRTEPLSAEIGLYLTLVAGALVVAGAAYGYNEETTTAGMYSHRR